MVGFYDARDIAACSGTCTWTPRAGFIGPLTGTAAVTGNGLVMNPRMVTTSNTGIVGSQAFTSMVGFQLLYLPLAFVSAVAWIHLLTSAFFLHSRPHRRMCGR